MYLSNIDGLSGQLIQFIDLKSFNFDNVKNECSCIIIPKKGCFNSKKNFDKGLLIAIIDTFSSYVVKYLCSEEDYRLFLSLRILFTSYQNINEDIHKKLKLNVSLDNKADRDIIINIKVLDMNNKILAQINHLKRKLNKDYFKCSVE